MKILTHILCLHAGLSALNPEWQKEPHEDSKLLKRGIGDEVQPVGDSILEVNMQSGIAGALFEGDIVLTEEQQDQIAADMSRARSKRQAFDARGWQAKLWSDGVPYMFSFLGETAENAFRKAAQIWEENTCINFTEYKMPKWRKRSVIKPLPKNYPYLVVFAGVGCESSVGRVKDEGPQELSLGRGCETIGHASHEIGHALGFFHTHTRHDRDQFITVHKDNIKSGWQNEYDPQTPITNNNYNLTYDYGSVMHYGTTSGLSRDGSPIMVPHDANYTQTLGSSIISFYDLLMMNMLYNCTDACKGEANTKEMCKNGGFPHPRKCSECICPSGYGGQFCEKRPEGCGKELVAEDDWKLLTDELDGSDAGKEKDGFKRCNYWIKAPNDENVIEVKIVELPAKAAFEGCTHAGVEIKAHSNKRLTGYRFCSPKAVDTTLRSNSSILPVITYNSEKRVSITKLKYRYIQRGF